MAKYSFEFKKQVVMEYLNGEGGKWYLAKKHNIKHPSTVINWVKKYQTYGDEGIKRSREQKKVFFRL